MGKEQFEEMDEEMTVELELDDGTNVTCAIITILEVEGKDYIVLMPLDENGQNDDGEVWFYRYSENPNDPNEEPQLDYIDDDAEYVSAPSTHTQQETGTQTPAFPLFLSYTTDTALFSPVLFQRRTSCALPPVPPDSCSFCVGRRPPYSTEEKRRRIPVPSNRA